MQNNNNSIISNQKLTAGDASKYWESGTVSNSYCNSRPSYPLHLCKLIYDKASLASVKQQEQQPVITAVDIGCGPGCCTLQLAHYFDKVIGVDPSSEQIAHAEKHDKIEYKCAAAEATTLAEQSVDAVIVAQVCYDYFFLCCFLQLMQILLLFLCFILLGTALL